MTVFTFRGKRYVWHYEKVLPGMFMVLGLAALAWGCGAIIGWTSVQTAALMGGM